MVAGEKAEFRSEERKVTKTAPTVQADKQK